MEAQLLHNNRFYFFQELDQVSSVKTPEHKPDLEPRVITCKAPTGLTRQERYQRIKALMNR